MRPCGRADILVYDVWASGDAEGAKTLIENIRDLHPDAPVVLTPPGLPARLGGDLRATLGDRADRAADGARLHEAIQAALATAPDVPR